MDGVLVPVVAIGRSVIRCRGDADCDCFKRLGFATMAMAME